MRKSQSSENFSNKIVLNKGKENFIEIEEIVRYSETDQMGVAHNKNYFEWFEIGRTEYCRQKNIPYKNIEAKKVVFAYELVTKEDKELIASGYTVHIVTNSKAQTRSLPPHIIDGLKAS